MSTAGSSRARVRAVADAVLYEGYLLYPYRADARKNRCRWQFGVLGPVGAHASGLGEESELAGQMPIAPDGDPVLRFTLRFLQLQHRAAAGTSRPDWDEAVEREISVGPCAPVAVTVPFEVPGGRDTEPLVDPATGRADVVRTRRPLRGEFELAVASEGGYPILTVTVRNTGEPATDRRDALARSMLGAHVIAEAGGAEFVSLLEPPPEAEAAVARCVQHRCFPVLAGPPGDRSLMLISPIILYDHPEIAEQSQESLYDATEIDEILTLRVMAMTDEEKAAARATDPRAARIVDSCDAMTAEQMARLHGVLRDPGAGQNRLVPEIPPGTDWWDPVADGAVRPDSDAVPIAGTLVRKGSMVRLHPARRADIHDMFFDGRDARVTSVHADVDGRTHVGVVIADDPGADLHEWYGRYLYFDPDELEPLDGPGE
ncbi:MULTISPECIES: hypothetical protein [Nocardia]|uniref:hypothetical protein n=1 Tax=Nocardia TaxID=1817 RepID=UPI0007EA2DE2|nr:MULTISPECIES: hypothetical protein [Nocardia]MBF6273943.1 hypothetical protein [Nocardia nova]OBA43407.1 hypothetical protein A5789_10775 [Nocardia sp. 852002-51101_SCH5132738]OBB34004.1 hypothetical protein A5748_07275 [Nocardia sp. 852002-51244_SCH5132740]OBF71294.1 hypothetical protein A9X06_30265 [Mycobacterium sp. 852002-51759_SCH5129042]